jgi:predicted MPP superfamily phosphohydrolase
MARRDFLGGIAAATGTMLAGAAGIGYASEVEPRRLAVERIAVSLPALSTAFDGLHIAQLSDLHRGPTTGLAEIEQAVAATSALNADLIVLTGDYVSQRAAYAAELTTVLATLRAPLGVYAVLGNHDHWTDPAVVSRHIRRAGIQLLVNEAVPLAAPRGTGSVAAAVQRAPGLLKTSSDSAVRNPQSDNSPSLWLAGVDDVRAGKADLPRALAKVPQAAPVLLLAHEPDFADVAAEHGVALQLSGHSHGGQVRVPGLGAPVLPYLARKYPMGLYRIGLMRLYVNRGIGTTTLGVRLNCLPEVTLLTLRGQS